MAITYEVSLNNTDCLNSDQHAKLLPIELKLINLQRPIPVPRSTSQSTTDLIWNSPRAAGCTITRYIYATFHTLILLITLVHHLSHSYHTRIQLNALVYHFYIYGTLLITHCLLSHISQLVHLYAFALVPHSHHTLFIALHLSTSCITNFTIIGPVQPVFTSQSPGNWTSAKLI